MDIHFLLYFLSEMQDADIDKATEKESLLVNWRMHKGNVWFHVSKDLAYYERGRHFGGKESGKGAVYAG